LDARALRAQAATSTFVQGRAEGITSGTTNSLAFNSANTAGNLIVAYLVWSNTGSVTLSDSQEKPLRGRGSREEG
jgi:hypothetical protein